jgi:hypothetical protein
MKRRSKSQTRQEGEIEIFYDELGDYLEIFFGKPAPDYGEIMGDDITIFRYSKTDKLYGLGIIAFKKRTKNFKPIKINLSKDIKILSKNKSKKRK